MEVTQAQLEAKVFKGLADQSRLAILEMLVDGSKTVTQLVNRSKLSQPNVSTHLACLLECGLVRRERQGRHMLYSIALKEVTRVLISVKAIIQKNAKEIYDCTTY